MNIEHYTYLLEHPEKITASDTTQLREIIDAFPFFQNAHALYLKGLKNQNSFSYNKALKLVAAHTTDRSILFEYITSQKFVKNDTAQLEKKQDEYIQSIPVVEAKDISTQVEKEEQEKASKILDPNLFVAKEQSTMTEIKTELKEIITSGVEKQDTSEEVIPKKNTPEETLQIGKPLTFTKQEAHSFTEWLQLSSFAPINRSEEKTEQSKAIDSQEEITPQLIENKASKNISKDRKQQLIDSFIDSNPKIKITPVNNSNKQTPIKTNLFSSEALMTETLARVYVEQKNFKKAKQAFRILSLKYPEKSGFFADQIRAIEKLEE